MELPPRARRIHKMREEARRTEGTTSACAENTSESLFYENGELNYLRVRGEYPI